MNGIPQPRLFESKERIYAAMQRRLASHGRDGVWWKMYIAMRHVDKILGTEKSNL